ncbi:MAG: tetratricopeptide repeat protein [Planctomycetes bacterium]|nr:tetratricopeptide repeat protein [Planctomycetota bacterium]
MFRTRCAKTGLAVALCTWAAAGCAVERATVSFGYVVEPERGLPEGMTAIAIEPPVLGPNTDPKWSDICVRSIQHLVNEARNEYGADVVLVDRTDTQVTFDEADLRAAGMSTDTRIHRGKLLAVQGKIIPSINVKVEKRIGTESTISGIDLGGYDGHYVEGGYIDIQTREVTTVTRTMTVQLDFKLVDTINNRDWEHYSPRPYVATDRTGASPLFGTSRTEADLTPRDRIVAGLVRRGVKEFVCRILPCRITVDADVVSSGHPACLDGVRLLRGEMYREALGSFRRALADNRSDHQAAFAAGIASEALGRYDDALRYYREACAARNSRKYLAARDRMKRYGSRIRD